MISCLAAAPEGGDLASLFFFFFLFFGSVSLYTLNKISFFHSVRMRKCMFPCDQTNKLDLKKKKESPNQINFKSCNWKLKLNSPVKPENVSRCLYVW